MSNPGYYKSNSLKELNKQFNYVSIINSNNRIQLRFNYLGERKYISVGLSYNSPNLALAKVKAAQLDLDLLHKNVDTTWDKYKCIKNLRIVKELPKRSLLEVWEKYSTYKESQITITTLNTTYRTAKNHIIKSNIKSPYEGRAFKNYLCKACSPNAAKKNLSQVTDCIVWAVKNGLVTENTFEGLAQEIKVPKQDDEANIDPYNSDEIEAIFAAFKEDQYYSYYENYFRFCYLTGCRPSEAVGLKQKYVEIPKFVFFKETYTNGNWKQKPKNGKSRKFPMNQQLLELFNDVDLTGSSENLVFPSIRSGSPIKKESLRKAWIKVQEKAGVRYRYPYQLRHTFATKQIEANVPPNHVAKLIGDRLETVIMYYVGRTSAIQVAPM